MTNHKALTDTEATPATSDLQPSFDTFVSAIKAEAEKTGETR